jgi:hypothetical protein
MIKEFYEWENWTGIMHHLLLLLIVYISYNLIIARKERTLTNILLFSIILGIDIIIHQIINLRNNKNTSYSL